MSSSVLRFARQATTSVPLSRAYTGRANSFGFLRLVFAFAVVLAHAAVLGFSRPLTLRVDIPGLAVAGFFGISGFLITRSARRSSLPRFLWHRALRILPGLWACLLFITLVVAPVLWYARYGTLDGLLRHPKGVLNYLQQNWWGGHRAEGIRGLLTNDTPYGRQVKKSVMNGSLWTLGYEIFCYLLVAVVAVLGILKRARWLLLAACVVVFGVLVFNQYEMLRFGHDPIWTYGGFGPIPLLGAFSKVWFLRYGFMFLAGAVAELYSDRLPINDVLGVGALGVLGWYAFNHQLFGPGLLAYEYVILWAAVRLPALLHRVGQRNDYSYGVYIYAFIVQQVMAKAGVQAIGFVGYFLATAAVSSVLAFLSWHLVEKQALRLKEWTPRRPGQRGNRAAPVEPASSGTEASPARGQDSVPAPTTA